jgi:FAD/FMN-containing dehydrogenase
MNSVDMLRDRVRGEVLEPGDDGYDEHRKVYNAMHDRFPGVIVRAQGATDVAATVRYAADRGVDLAVRDGGHSVPGYGTCDDGVVLDLSPMKHVHVDPASRTARIGGGATWGEVDAATHAFGLATTGGVISTTGVSGLTLGGGIGYLTRACGLSCDNVVSADVVTADGRLVTANKTQHPDLFWALRGGGGNFGVVVDWEFRLHAVDTIIGGPLLYEADDAPKVMAFYRDFIDDAPEQLGAFFAWQIAPPLPFIPADRHGDLFCALVTCWTGPKDRAAPLFDAMREAADVKAEHVGEMPYPALNCAFDALVPKGLQHYWKADFVAELTDEAIDAHVEHGLRTPIVNSTMHLYPLNGAAQRVAPDATAFAHRDMKYAAVIAGMWPDPADNEANIGWVKDYYAAIHPHSGSEGGYVNFMAGDDQHRVAANYGPNYQRLAEIKAIYDPGNLFHLNQNVEPASPAATAPV